VSAPTPLEERILVLAPTGRDAVLTCALLEKAEIACAMCKSLPELCRRLEQEGAAALMIAEEVFVNGGLAQLSEQLSRQSSWSDIPVLIFTGKTLSLHVQRTTSQLLSSIANVTLLDRPLRPVTMLSAARTALRARRRQYIARAELHAQQRAVRERDQFLAMLGHELRNPLSAITMALELDTSTQRSKHGEIVRRQVRHLTRLVDDLLDVARVTSGKVVLRREEVDLRALLQRCVNALRPSSGAGTTLCELRSHDPPVWVHADPVRLEQVITNLINNAMKYTTAGGVVEVSVAAEGDDAVLRVHDTGVGLAPDMIDRVFELFTQVEDTLDRAKGGMGIGLTLVRSLVTLHGGTVQAQSAGLGQGSLFTVRLPRLANTPDVRAREAQRKDSNTDLQPCDVLIIEDNDDSRELLAAILEQRGHRVFTAQDGPRGVSEALARRPRVVLIDIGLPGLDGYGVARSVREKLGRSVYMVAITGYGQPEDRTRALEAGFDLHLIKPIDIAVLERLLSREVLKLVC
jgi:signal transduction histidine kinase/CheY-like chemotaxis protein